MPSPPDNNLSEGEQRTGLQPAELPAAAQTDRPVKTFWKTVLKKMGISARLAGKELQRLKIRQIDLGKADLRLGEKAYATGATEAEPELVSRLDRVAERLTQLQRQEIEPASTFGDKAKAFASKVGKAVQISALQRKRRRILRRLGANLRQSAANSSLVEETQLARGVADRVSSVETEIRQLAPQTYPWARRPLLLVCLLLLLAAIGGAFALRHKPTPALAQQRKVAGGSSLSDAQFKKLESQAQAFREQLLRQQAEMSRQEAEATQARSAAAERAQKQDIERRRAEQERVRREEAERERVAAAERARQEEKQREEERRVAEAEKAKQEQQQREAEAQREKERQEAAAREEQRKKEAAQYAKNEAARNQLVAQNSPSQPGAQPRPANSPAIESIEGLRRAAEAGDAEAMLRLGNRYRTGEGVQQDFTEAVRCYRNAADAGQKDAMLYLGIGYYYGYGVDKDVAEALGWYRKAADAGNANAMVNLGVCYYKGEGVAEDPAEAERWFRKAAEAGNTDAIKWLQHLQNGKKLWENMLVLSDGRHVAVDRNGEFYVYKSMSMIADPVKLTGAAKEEAKRLHEERQQKRQQDLQNLKKAWDNMLVLSDGRHVEVGKNDEFVAYKSMTDDDPVKLTGAAKEEAKRLLEEHQQKRQRNP